MSILAKSFVFSCSFRPASVKVCANSCNLEIVIHGIAELHVAPGFFAKLKPCALKYQPLVHLGWR